MSTEQTDAGLQHVLPGAERASDATLVQGRADAPLRARKPQAPCDVGLFGDSAAQTDLLEQIARDVAADAAARAKSRFRSRLRWPVLHE